MFRYFDICVWRAFCGCETFDKWSLQLLMNMLVICACAYILSLAKSFQSRVCLLQSISLHHVIGTVLYWKCKTGSASLNYLWYVEKGRAVISAHVDLYACFEFMFIAYSIFINCILWFKYGSTSALDLWFLKHDRPLMKACRKC
jgi:hypothetical protein